MIRSRYGRGVGVADPADHVGDGDQRRGSLHVGGGHERVEHLAAQVLQRLADGAVEVGLGRVAQVVEHDRHGHLAGLAEPLDGVGVVARAFGQHLDVPGDLGGVVGERPGGPR